MMTDVYLVFLDHSGISAIQEYELILTILTCILGSNVSSQPIDGGRVLVVSPPSGTARGCESPAVTPRYKMRPAISST